MSSTNNVKQSDVRLLPSEPCVLLPAAAAAVDNAATTTTVVFPLLDALRADPRMTVFRPYLETLPEEDQIAVAMRLEMEHIRDTYILDRTIGYKNWAVANPEKHRDIMARKPVYQKLVLPPQLDLVLASLPSTT